MARREHTMPDRQQKEAENTRPDRARSERVPMHQRDLLSVHGKDPDKYYRWCLDVNDKLLRYQKAGYEFVSDPALAVGEMSVNPTTRTGDVISKMSGERILYLMAIDRELYESDKRAQAIEIDEMEKTMHAQTNREGDYGEYRVDNDMRAR